MKPFSISLMRTGKIVRWRGADAAELADVVHEVSMADVKWDRIEVEPVSAGVCRTAPALQAHLDGRWS